MGELAVTINYKDSRRTESKRAGSGPILVVIAAVGGLLLFAPQSTTALGNFVVWLLTLPRS